MMISHASVLIFSLGGFYKFALSDFGVIFEFKQ